MLKVVVIMLFSCGFINHSIYLYYQNEYCLLKILLHSCICIRNSMAICSVQKAFRTRFN